MTDEIEKNIQFVNDNIISDDDYLWKYLDLHKFLSFIISKSIHLTRLDKFEDKREGISPIHLLYQNHKKELDNHPMFEKIRTYMTIDTLGGKMNKIEDELKKIQRFNYASCWVIGKKQTESVAMWNLYSDPKSLAIRIKYSDFKKNTLENGYKTNGMDKELICSPVNYLNFQDKKNIAEYTNNLLDSVFLKDISFKHENEFRIIAREKEREIPSIYYKPNITRSHIEKLHNSIYNNPGTKVELKNFEKYNFEIVHHPKSTNWTKENINEIIKKFKIGFDIYDSNLELK
tara:strand:+ start:198 stop:1061 length:864 start_codon:yes stop_codon:yes gene_type:complete